MSHQDYLAEIQTWLLSELPTGEFAIRIEPDEWHDVQFCVDTVGGRNRRTIQVDREFIEDAARKGGSSYVIKALKDQHVVERLLAELDHRVTDPIVLRHL